NSAIFTELMPYVEQEVLKNAAATTDVTAANEFKKTPVLIFACPTNERGPALVTVTSSTENSYSSSSTSILFGRVDYAANGGNTTLYSGVAKYEGPFRSTTTGFKVIQIVDGTSNTIAFGELSLTNCHTTTGPCYLAWSAKPAVKWSNYSPTPGGAHPGTWTSHSGFSSPHTGVCHFGFLDGSVRPLRLFGYYTGGSTSPAEYWTFQRLAGRADGEPDDGLLEN